MKIRFRISWPVFFLSGCFSEKHYPKLHYRHHHLFVHKNNWLITRTDGQVNRTCKSRLRIEALTAVREELTGDSRMQIERDEYTQNKI